MTILDGWAGCRAAGWPLQRWASRLRTAGTLPWFARWPVSMMSADGTSELDLESPCVPAVDRGRVPEPPNARRW